MLLVLKIPVVYLAVVVWWAIRAEPVAEGGGEGEITPVPLNPCGWDDWKRSRATRARWRRPLPGGGQALLPPHRARLQPA